MTARAIYEAMLIELNKVNAPSLLLEDYNYFINKAINQYINKRYAIYDINQQTTDDLRVLKATAVINVDESNKASSEYGGPLSIGSASLYGATYSIDLPDDYLHVLNCICNYELQRDFKCYDNKNNVQFPATRLTADAWSTIINNAYMCPTYRRPYYYIHHVNTSDKLPTNLYKQVSYRTMGKGTDQMVDSDKTILYLFKVDDEKMNDGTAVSVFLNGDNEYQILGTTKTVKVKEGEPFNPGLQEGKNKNLYFKGDRYSASFEEDSTVLKLEAEYPLGSSFGKNTFNRTVVIDNHPESTIPSERNTFTRLGNPSKVRCEIRYGKDDSVFKLTKVFVDYIKIPQYIRLTQEQVDLTVDTSQVMEFPDYVCQEIINELVLLVMENASDQRVKTQPIVSQSIANPAQQQATPTQAS